MNSFRFVGSAVLVAAGIALCAPAGIAQSRVKGGVSRPLGVPNYQPSHSSLSIGGPVAMGDNGSTNPATLSDGTAATGVLDFDYDPATALLTVTVRNTSPVVPGLNTAVMGDVYLNAPLALAAVDAVLVSQAAEGGADPAYGLSVDLDPYDLNGVNDTGYFGCFSLRLIAPAGGGIAATGATGTPAIAVTGPAVFTLQLIGSMDLLQQVTADYPVKLQSVPGPLATMVTNAAVPFYNAGDGSGIGIISDVTGDCNPIAFWSGNNRIGHTQTLFVQATPGCHGCEVWSPILATSNLPPAIGIQLEIGGPQNSLNFILPWTFTQVGFHMLSYTIPNDINLIGVTRYWQFMTNPVTGITTTFEKSPFVTTTYLP